MADLETEITSLSPPSKPEDPSAVTCWICKDQGLICDLIVPCECGPRLGVIHRQCLLDWINTLYKGRCPRCAYMFRVMAEKKPHTRWELDSFLLQRKRRCIIALIMNVVISAMCITAFGYFVSNIRETGSITSKYNDSEDDRYEYATVTNEPETAVLEVTNDPESAVLKVMNEPEPAVLKVMNEPEPTLLKINKCALKIILSVVVAVGYFLYVVYHVKLYTGIYERLRIYNNTVWHVYDIKEIPDPACEVRGNISSFVNQSEYQYSQGEYSSTIMKE